MDRVGFEPTTSAMPMPYPTGLDDRPYSNTSTALFGINTFNMKIITILSSLTYWYRVALEQSIGAVIKYQPSPENIESSEFLLLKNKRGFWGFPQGHKEKGETEIQTLIREVSEETGITYLDIQSFVGRIRYSYFKADGMKAEKEVRFYFATTSTRQIRLSAEHGGFMWVTFLDALSILDHRQLKSILVKGHRKGLY
jgi:bis(5'-nucleosidyl)-tetraphosphatase